MPTDTQNHTILNKTELSKPDLNQKNPFKNVPTHMLQQCVAPTSQVKTHVLIF